MYGRPTILFPLALLAFLALLTLWIDRSVLAPGHKSDGNTRHDPDYMLNNFVTTSTDINGDLHYILAATEMKHFPDDDSTELKRPRFTQFGIDQPYTQIEGQRGLVSSNGDNVQFMDNVKVVRQATEDRGELTVLTEYLSVTPKQDLATTDRPVVITEAPETVIHATGMIFDKKQQTIQLLKHVRAHYVPQRAPAKPSAHNKNAPAKTAVKAKTGKPPVSKRETKPKTLRSSPDKNKKAKPASTTNQNNTRIRRKYEHPVSP